jgi:hypothetical protein
VIALDTFHEWLEIHKARHTLTRLPSSEGVTGKWYYGLWLKRFNEMGADVPALQEASEKLADEPPKQGKDHWPLLRGLVADVLRSRGLAVGDATTRETAEAASKECERCGGGGLTTVWHPEPAYELKRPETVSATCACPMGRWVRRRWAELKQDDLIRRTPDWTDVQNGRSMWLAERPVDLARPYVLPEHRWKPPPPRDARPPAARIAADPILQREYQRPVPESEA